MCVAALLPLTDPHIRTISPISSLTPTASALALQAALGENVSKLSTLVARIRQLTADPATYVPAESVRPPFCSLSDAPLFQPLIPHIHMPHAPSPVCRVRIPSL